MAWLQLLGRVKPGISLAQARQHLIPIISSSIYANATADDLRSLKDRPLEYFIASGARGFSSVRETFAAPLVTLMVGVGLLLCVVCVNVANLLLARGAARRREMSLRLAIGANRARIVRQLLTESIVLALVSGVAALLVGWWGSVALVTLASEGESISLGIAPNVNVLAFTFLLSIMSVVVFGLAPALRTSRVDLAAAIRTESRSFSASARSGVLLIIGQVALSLVLLAGASVLTRSLRRVEATDLGLDRAPAGLGSLGHGECPACHDPAPDHDGELRVGRVQPEDDAAGSGPVRNQAREAVDPDADEARRETGVPQDLTDPLLAPALDRHEQNAQGAARLLRQDLEVEERLAGREGEMALQLEPHHLAEVRAGDGRQLDRLGDHGAAGESHPRAPRADARFQELPADRTRGVLVGRDAEGREQASGTQPLPEGHHVDLPVTEREPDDVAHRAALLDGWRVAEALGAGTAGSRAASDQRQARGTV